MLVACDRYDFDHTTMLGRSFTSAVDSQALDSGWKMLEVGDWVLPPLFSDVYCARIPLQSQARGPSPKSWPFTSFRHGRDYQWSFQEPIDWNILPKYGHKYGTVPYSASMLGSSNSHWDKLRLGPPKRVVGWGPSSSLAPPGSARAPGCAAHLSAPPPPWNRWSPPDQLDLGQIPSQLRPESHVTAEV